MLFKFQKIVGCIEPLVKNRDTNWIVGLCIVTALITTITHLLHIPLSHYIHLSLTPTTLFIYHPHTSYNGYTYYTSYTFIIHNTPITHSSVLTHALHPLLIYYTHNQQMHIYYTSTPHIQSLGASSYTVILNLVTFTTHFTHT